MNPVRHVCYLIDGCRTHAILNNKTGEDMFDFAYVSGADAMGRLQRMSFDKFGIPFLSIALTTRNNHVSRGDIMKVVPHYVPALIVDRWTDYFMERGVRVRFIGDLKLFVSNLEDPERVLDSIRRVEEQTAENSKHHLFYMVAYESAHEYIRFLSETDGFEKMKREELVRRYYGVDVPPVDFIIRSWRPRLSSCIPIMVGEYSDFYAYTAPFQSFDEKAYSEIIDDYKSRVASKGGGFRYEKEDLDEVGKLKDAIRRGGNPHIIGSRIRRSWVPLRINKGIEEFAMRQMGHHGAHDFSHASRVRSIALDIAGKEEADKRIVEAAALLHDIVRPESGESENSHSRLSSDASREILAKSGFSQEETGRVIGAIETHSLSGPGSVPETPEARVLFDADKIEGLGQIGIARWFMYCGNRGMGIRESAETYLKKITEFEKSMGRLYTRTGTEMATEGLAFSKSFAERIISEIKRLE